MMVPNWKYIETVKKRIRITRVNTKERHMDAVDLESNTPICMDAAEKIDFGKIKKAKIYCATIKVYRTDITAELESQMIESSLHDINRLRAIQSMKASRYKPRRFELIELTH